MENIPDIASLKLSISDDDDDDDFIVIQEDQGSLTVETKESLQESRQEKLVEQLKVLVQVFQDAQESMRESNEIIRHYILEAGEAVHKDVLDAMSKGQEAAATLRPIEQALTQLKGIDNAYDKVKVLEAENAKLKEEKRYLLAINAELNTRDEQLRGTLADAARDSLTEISMARSDFRNMDLSRYLLEIDKLEKQVKELDEENKKAKQYAMDDLMRKQHELDLCNEKLSASMEEIKKAKSAPQENKQDVVDMSQLLDNWEEEIVQLKQERDCLLSTLRIKEDEMKELTGQLEHLRLKSQHEPRYESTVLVERPPDYDEKEELVQRLQVQVKQNEELSTRCEDLEDENATLKSFHVATSGASDQPSLPTLQLELRKEVESLKIEVRELQESQRALQVANERLNDEKACMLEERRKEVEEFDEMKKRMDDAIEERDLTKIMSETYQEDFLGERECRERIAGEREALQDTITRLRDMFGGSLPGFDSLPAQADAAGNQPVGNPRTSVPHDAAGNQPVGNPRTSVPHAYSCQCPECFYRRENSFH